MDRKPENATPASDSAPEVDSTAEGAEEEPLTGPRALYDFVMQSYCWLVIFFVIYVLSIGPFHAKWRAAVDMGEKPLLQAVYLPLAGLCHQSETLNNVVEWYVELWQS